MTVDSVPAVLVVTADREFRDTIAEQFDERFEIYTARTAEDAVERLHAEPIECILSEYDLPRTDGVRLLQTVRAHDPNLPFVLATEHRSEETASDAVAANVTEYLVKTKFRDQWHRLADLLDDAIAYYRRRTDLEGAAMRTEDVLDAIPQAIAIVQDGRIVFLNERGRELLAAPSLEELRSNRLDRWITTDESASIDDVIDAVLSGELSFEQRRCELTTENGITVPLETSIGSVTWDDTPAAAVVLTDRSATELIERDLSLKTRSMDTAPIGITLADAEQPDHPLIYVNDHFERLSGYDEDEILGRNARFLQGDDTAEEPVAELRRAIDAGEPTTVELRNYHKDGSEFWNRVTVAPVRNEGDEVTHYVGFQEDLTELKERTRELERNRDLLRQTETIAQTGGWELDGETGAVRWTDGTYRIHGLDPDSEFDPTTEGALSFYHPDDRGEIEQAVENCLNAGSPYDLEVRLITDDGRVRWVRTRGEPVFEDGAIVGARGGIRDITESKERRLELRRFREAVEAAGQAIFITDTDGTITYANPAFEDVTGYNPAEAVGETPSLLNSGQYDEEYYRRLWETILDGETWNDELVDRRKSGETYYTLQTISPILDEDGDVEEFVAVQTDITAQKEHEKHLATLDRALRHDLRNRLNILQGYAETAYDAVDDTKAKRHVALLLEVIDELLEMADRGREINAMLLDRPQRRMIDLVPAVRDAVDRLGRTHEDVTIELVEDCPESVTVFATDTLPDAIEALLEYRLSYLDGSDSELVVRIDGGANDTVQIQIEDTGEPIPKIERRAFEEAYEIDDLQHGTGFELWFVYWTVRQSAGSLSFADSASDRAAVTIEFDAPAS